MTYRNKELQGDRTTPRFCCLRGAANLRRDTAFDEEGSWPSVTAWGSALAEGSAAVQRYGGASLGDRTMLDALLPAAAALCETTFVGEVSRSVCRRRACFKISLRTRRFCLGFMKLLEGFRGARLYISGKTQTSQRHVNIRIRTQQPVVCKLQFHPRTVQNQKSQESRKSWCQEIRKILT